MISIKFMHIEGATTGHIDHKIARQTKIEESCAILAIVSVVADAEYALGEGARPIIKVMKSTSLFLVAYT